MANKIFFFSLLILFLNSCSSNEDISIQNKKLTVNFIHEWDGTPITKNDFNVVKFATKNEDTLSIERYRYVLSNIKLIDNSGFETPLLDYMLIDLGEEQNLSFTIDKLILDRNYTLNFTFGFTDADNTDGTYVDLNTANFNVPTMLGGGYHYMQFDGKYISSTTTTPAGFNYHAIRAINLADPANIIHRDTSFEVNLNNIVITGNEATIDVKVNIAEWFKNPNTWDLDVLNQMLMPNFDAQVEMNSNGRNVFSL